MYGAQPAHVAEGWGGQSAQEGIRVSAKPTKSARVEEAKDTLQLFASGQPITIRATEPKARCVAAEGALQLTQTTPIEVRLAPRPLQSGGARVPWEPDERRHGAIVELIDGGPRVRPARIAKRVLAAHSRTEHEIASHDASQMQEFAPRMRGPAVPNRGLPSRKVPSSQTSWGQI